MKPFEFAAPETMAEALSLLSQGSHPIAGGSDLLGELKEGNARFARLVSLGRIGELREIRHEAAGLAIGAGVTLAELAAQPRLLGPYRVLAEAARGVATPEIRNQGTLGGNLFQRPRCLHYRSPWVLCAKKGGAGCPAAASPYQHYLSVFGGGGCVAVHASDLAPCLIALRAVARVAGARGRRSLNVAELFCGPESDARREHVLAPDEMLTAVVLPPMHPEWKGAYLKARERAAGDFPLVSVAFGARLAEGRLSHVRLVLGAVAPTPLACPEAEAVLEGQAPSGEVVRQAAQAAFAQARPLDHNGYKLDLGRALIARAIAQVAKAG
ncbi:MAG: FAD binding domain-containing protein [SAR324 cluster bacterium]